MEKIKGLLKRRSLDVRTSVTSISAMEVVSDPENLAEFSPNNTASASPPPSTSAAFPTPESSPPSVPRGEGEDNTRALMMSKIEELTTEKYALQQSVDSLQHRLTLAETQNLTLTSTCDDLQNRLDIEKRRFRWQQKFYERRITQLTGLPTGATISSSPSPLNLSMTEEELPPSGTLRRLQHHQSLEDLAECNAFYEETIKALVRVQETQSSELQELRRYYDDKLKALTLDHESEVTEILESGNLQVERLIRENEALIRDLLTGCEGLFDQLKVEYTAEAQVNGQLQTSSGNGIIVQFQMLSGNKKLIVVAAITVISIATAGWASWGFIIWVWPRLIAFAEVLAANPETSLMWLLSFVNSVPFAHFCKAWEEGQSLGECLKAFANTEFLTSALRMAPELFAQFKNFQRQINRPLHQ